MSDWYQQSLTPPDVVEVNARFGLLPGENHCQWLIEVKDPVQGVLVGQWSAPHRTINPAGLTTVDEFMKRLYGVLMEQLGEPF